MENGDKTAYPCDGEYAGECRSYEDAGLTKREYFAGLAMESLAGIEFNESSSHALEKADRVARQAVFLADALLKALE